MLLCLVKFLIGVILPIYLKDALIRKLDENVLAVFSHHILTDISQISVILWKKFTACGRNCDSLKLFRNIFRIEKIKPQTTCLNYTSITGRNCI